MDIREPKDHTAKILLAKGHWRVVKSLDEPVVKDWWSDLFEKTSVNKDYDSAATIVLILAKHMPGINDNPKLKADLNWIAQRFLKEA